MVDLLVLQGVESPALENMVNLLDLQGVESPAPENMLDLLVLQGVESPAPEPYQTREFIWSAPPRQLHKGLKIQ